MNGKNLKAILCLLLSVTLLIGLSFSSSANTNPSNNLQIVAENCINVTQTADNEGYITTTFTHLDDFISEVRKEYPTISDYDIATFIYEFTNQEYSDLPENEIILILDCDNITTSETFIRIDDEGNSHISGTDAVPLADWTSTDGYMKITTTYSHLKTVGNEKYYYVSARGTWQKYPAIALQDAFALGTSGTFDDSYSEYGSVSQTFKCKSGCGHTYTYRDRSVSSTSQTDGDLTLKYNNIVPTMHFVPISPRCDYCGGNSTDHYFSVYLRYGMIADESVNIQAGYAHKTVGVGNISVGIDITGTPSFSCSLSTVEEYIARPVTVTY